jgi:hypothetical protein
LVMQTCVPVNGLIAKLWNGTCTTAKEST